MKGDIMNNYYKVVNDFLTIAKQNPFIKGVEYGNIYEQHNSGNIEYNTFTLTQGENSSQTENEITYNFIAFVTDRLLEDKSNLLYVQSSCKTILDTILTTFKEKHSGWSIDTETFSFWEEKFNDYCAGCFVNFSVTMPIEFSCVGVIEEGGANTIEITSNGTYDVTNYDTAVVNVSGSVSDLKYYWIMPHNYGVPQINYSDNTTTLEIKFRLKSTVNQSIYDDGYTSLIYEDNQYKARLNGGEWKETLIRETDATETRVVKLTGTKLQIGYYLFDLEDGGHKWSYGQQMYIGKGENVGDINIYYCKLYWDKGDFVDYEPFIENGETVLKDAVSGNVLSIEKEKDDTLILNFLNNGGTFAYYSGQRIPKIDWSKLDKPNYDYFMDTCSCNWDDIQCFWNIYDDSKSFKDAQQHISISEQKTDVFLTLPKGFKNTKKQNCILAVLTNSNGLKTLTIDCNDLEYTGMFLGWSGTFRLKLLNTSKLKEFYNPTSNIKLDAFDCSSLIKTPYNAAHNQTTYIGGFIDLGKGFLQNGKAGNHLMYFDPWMQNLTKESLLNIFNGLYDLNLLGFTFVNQPTIKLGATNFSRLTEEDIKIATDKGWIVTQ